MFRMETANALLGIVLVVGAIVLTFAVRRHFLNG